LDFDLLGSLIPLDMPHKVRVPRGSVLPPASFRLRLTVDTLALS
jgi:hypothetical protein